MVNWTKIVKANPGVLQDYAENVLSLRAAIQETRNPEARRELYKVEKLYGSNYGRRVARKALRRRGFFVETPTRSN